MIVQGPYLVRTAAIDKKTIQLTGDWLNSTALEVFAPSSVSQVQFNGVTVRTSRTSYGSLTGKLGACPYSVNSILAELPSLSRPAWKVSDGLPERNASYDDSRWTSRIPRDNSDWLQTDMS